MKNTFLITLLFVLVSSSYSQNKIEINDWLTAGPVKIYRPIFQDSKDINNKAFTDADFLKSFKLSVDQLSPELNSNVALGNKMFKWEQLTIAEDSIISQYPDSSNVFFLVTYIAVDQWINATLKFNSNALFEVYIDGEIKKSKTSPKLNETSVNVDLNTGKHLVFLKVLSVSEKTKFKCSVSYDEQLPATSLQSGLNPKRIIGIDDIIYGTKISSFKISPSGNYLLINYAETIIGTGTNKSYSVLKNLKTGKNVSIFHNQNVSDVKWLPKTDRLSYALSVDKASDIIIYDVANAKETIVSTGIKSLSGYQWSPTEDFLIYSENVKAEKADDLKRIYANDDRLPYFRNRSRLHLLNIVSGNSIQITSGNLSANLQDIHPSGLKALISTSRVDHTEVPFRKQNLYELNLATFKNEIIWKDKNYSGSAKYSPDGEKLLVQGGPDCFGEVGRNIKGNKIANNYDQQLYIFDLKTKSIDPITLRYAPSVNSAFWSPTNELFVAVTEKDYRNLYVYSFKTKKFRKIEIETEVLDEIEFARDQTIAAYSGTSISTPGKLFLIDLKNEKNTEIDFPEKKKYKNIEFGTNEKWNFLNKNKTTIYGRIYYPPGYDKSKKYPVIVNYYGGTSPIGRSFGGRYPANIWTANGYIVYIMQPSGATGFGQDFSALHVNGWGFDAIDDIIDGTKEFLKTHPSADAENVGCIGASYGGFTTMLLQTRTDIFKTAVSHAGISSITSYWGEGYWGYSYSAVATANSYPWNRKDIYVENSPLYNADKFKNSILLLHGTDDTNVPVGESLQYYAALKILGKEVEMVLVDGQNHWIVDLKKRKKWHYTIMSWFDKKLKNQPKEWNNLYPEKNL